MWRLSLGSRPEHRAPIILPPEGHAHETERLRSPQQIAVGAS